LGPYLVGGRLDVGPEQRIDDFAVSLLVEIVSSVTIENVRFAPAPSAGLVAQAFRVLSVSNSADLLNLSFVRAGYGVWATGTGGATRATLRNVTGAADGDLITLLGMQTVDASLISGTAGLNGFTFTAGGFLTSLSLRDAVLQAARTGVLVVSDNLGTVLVENVSFGTSGVRPLLGLSIASAGTAVISRVATDGLPNGTLINDVARTMVSRMSFRDKPDAKTIPIVKLEKDKLASWLKRQDEATRGWIESTGFKAEANALSLVPGADGRLARVLIGIDDPFDPEKNIAAGTKYFRYLLDRFDDLRCVPCLPHGCHGLLPSRVRHHVPPPGVATSVMRADLAG